jgi:hypothetical protein
MRGQVSEGKKGGRVSGLTKSVKGSVSRQGMEGGWAGNKRRTGKAANVGRMVGKAGR